MSVLYENDKNLCPFFDIGLIQGKDDEASRIIFYEDPSASPLVVRSTFSNGIILTPTGSNLNNTLTNSCLKIVSNNNSGPGAFCFSLFKQGKCLLENGKKYIIVFDITGMTNVNADLIGFTDTLTNLITNNYYPNNGSYKNILYTGSNLNCYFIFTCNQEIVTTKKNFMIGWSNLTGAIIDLKLTTLQLYDITDLAIDGIDNFELQVLKLLKTHSYLENETDKYNANGVIEFFDNGSYS